MNEHQRTSASDPGEWDGATHSRQEAREEAAVSDEILAAALCSLAGVRTGDRVGAGVAWSAVRPPAP